MAAALRYLARTLCRPPAGTPEGRQDEEGAEEIDVAWNMQKEVENLLAKLNDGGVEIDEGAARILEEEIARIAQEAARSGTRDAAMEARSRNSRIRWYRRRSMAPATTTVFCLSLLTIASASGYAGYLRGFKAYEDIIFSKENSVYVGLAFMFKYFLEKYGQ